MNITLLVSNIQKLCDEHEISVNQMLQECGLHKSTIDHMKKEKPSIPSIDKILPIAEYFNVSVDYLLGYTPKMEIEDKKQKFFDLVSDLSSEEMEMIYNVVEAVIKTVKKPDKN